MLLLITLFNAQADDTPTYAPVTVIDFEDLDVNVDIEKPQIVFVKGTKRPEVNPGDLIQMFIVEPSKKTATPISLEETPFIGEEK